MMTNVIETKKKNWNGRPADLLLVEDNPADVILVEEALKEGSIKVRLSVVEDGEEALDFLHRRERFSEVPAPDLILLDLNLPKINGHEVLSEIRGLDHLKNVPIVVLTASSSDSDIIKSYGRGATCYITKPFGFYKFMEAVKTIEHLWFELAKLPPRPESAPVKI